MKNIHIKHFVILFTAIVLSSCCSTKQVVEQAPKEEQKEVVEVITQETSKPPKTDIEKVISEEVIETTNDSVFTETIERFNHNSWNELLQKHVTDNGNVDYKGLKKDRTSLQNYITTLNENLPNEHWSKEKKLAYWMNAYNAMTIDLILRNYPLNSIKDIDKPWDQRLWKLGDKWYNLNDIEHKILRKMNEPRIHFGIVCASFSCPRLINQAFTAQNLESQLTSATKDFLADKNRNEISQNNIKLSKIFQWFAKDFKKDGSLIDFLNKYSDIPISNKAKKSYLNYNWSLNE